MHSCIRGWHGALITKMQTGILHTYLAENGAQVLSRDDLQLQDNLDAEDDVKTPFSPKSQIGVIVPHDISISELDAFSSTWFLPSHCSLVTDWWVEKCLYDKTLASKDFVLYQPLKNHPIEGMFSAEQLLPHAHLSPCRIPSLDYMPYILSRY